MSEVSLLLSALEGLQLNDYATVALATVIGYDYLLTFRNEVEYIWCRSWTWVSTLFVIVRYLGCAIVMAEAFFGSTFVPGPVEVSYWFITARRIHKQEYIQGYGLNLIVSVGYPIFIATADVVMILRVYAMYDRSKIVLGVLLAIYVIAIIPAAVVIAITNDPNSLTVVAEQVLNYTVCALAYSNASLTIGKYVLIPRFILSTLLCILAVAKFVRGSLQMYKTTKRWQFNRYMNVLVREGILYFVANLVYMLSNVFTVQTPPSDPIGQVALYMIAYIVQYILSPRFIMSVRQLYVRDLDGRREGIDTGFGMSTRGAGNLSTIDFTGDGPNHVVEEEEEMRVRGDTSAGTTS